MEPITEYIARHVTRTAAAAGLGVNLSQLQRFEKLDGYVRNDGEIYLPRRQRGLNRIPRKSKAIES